MDTQWRFFLLLILLPILSEAQVNTYGVEFVIENLGVETKGTFETVHALIKFDPGALDKSAIEATVSASSIRTGIAIRDKHLMRSDYFDVDKYPEIRLKSTSFKKTKKDVFIGQFDLTIKDVTRSVSIPFSITRKGNRMIYKGILEINRLDFKLGESSTVLADKVKIILEATGPRKP